MAFRLMKSDPVMYGAYHARCGRLAFWYRPPLEGAVLGGRVLMLDGSKPFEGGKNLKCGSCGSQIVAHGELKPSILTKPEK